MIIFSSKSICDITDFFCFKDFLEGKLGKIKEQDFILA
jgi:hypothetical protein